MKRQICPICGRLMHRIEIRRPVDGKHLAAGFYCLGGLYETPEQEAQQGKCPGLIIFHGTYWKPLNMPSSRYTMLIDTSHPFSKLGELEPVYKFPPDTEQMVARVVKEAPASEVQDHD